WRPGCAAHNQVSEARSRARSLWARRSWQTKPLAQSGGSVSTSGLWADLIRPRGRFTTYVIGSTCRREVSSRRALLTRGRCELLQPDPDTPAVGKLRSTSCAHVHGLRQDKAPARLHGDQGHALQPHALQAVPRGSCSGNRSAVFTTHG